jgi:hypothetical protein
MDEQSRVRMNFAQTAKGFVQMDVTVEFPTVDEAEKEGGRAIDAYRRICAAKGFVLVEGPALSPAGA